MILSIQFNAEDPKTLNVQELHVYFDRNTLQLVIEDQQLTSIWRELDQLDFPNQSLTLVVADVASS